MVKEKNARKHRPKHLCLEYSICFATGEPGPAHPDVASLLKYQKRLARHAGAPLPPHGHSPNKPSPPGLVVVVVVARAEGRVLALCPKLVNVEVPPFGGLDELLRHKVLMRPCTTQGQPPVHEPRSNKPCTAQGSSHRGLPPCKRVRGVQGSAGSTLPLLMPAAAGQGCGTFLSSGT